MKHAFVIHVVALAIIAFHCGPSAEGLRVRARSPLISEASRRLSLALRADGYTIEDGSILGLYHLTGWRALKENEKSEKEKRLAGTVDARIEIRLVSRGSLYDIIVTITLRNAEGTYSPDAGDPIVLKWQRIIRELVEPDVGEEG